MIMVLRPIGLQALSICLSGSLGLERTRLTYRHITRDFRLIAVLEAYPATGTSVPIFLLLPFQDFTHSCKADM
jgi:hypothetical protein